MARGKENSSKEENNNNMKINFLVVVFARKPTTKLKIVCSDARVATIQIVPTKSV